MNYTYAEYFLGIGSPGKAIKRVTARHGDTCKFVYGFEIDKYARNAFAAIHDVDENLIYHDITDQPDELPHVDIVFYSPPCQSFSLAGKREGTTIDKGNLFYNALQGIIKSNPKYCIMENVSNLKNQFADDYNAMLRALHDAGYVNDGKVLNTKYYGLPQNRERIFIVSIRKNLYEQGQRFEFPNEVKLEKVLRDLLEAEVDEKYYLSEKIVSRFVKTDTNKNIAGTTAPECRSIGQRDLVYKEDCTIGALMASDYKQPKQILETVNQIGNLNPDGSFNGNPQAGRIYGIDGIAPTLSTMQGEGQEPKILINSATKSGTEDATIGDSVNLEHPGSDTRRGRVGKGVAQTLTTSCNQGVILPTYRIRKLTPLECFRLQGFDDVDYYKAVAAYDLKWKKGASDSQMYKRAGNSISVPVEEEMLENLLYDRKQIGAQIGLF